MEIRTSLRRRSKFAHDITGKIHKTVEHSRGLLVKPLDVFKAALDLAPERNDLFVGLAQAHEMEGGWFNATKCWQRALATSPDVAEWQLGLGVAAWRSGDIFASAQALYQAMLLGSSAADSFFLSNIVATRARRLIIRVLHGNIGSIVTPSKESGLYPRETLVRLRKIVEEFILRLELRFEEFISFFGLVLCTSENFPRWTPRKLVKSGGCYEQCT